MTTRMVGISLLTMVCCCCTGLPHREAEAAEALRKRPPLASPAFDKKLPDGHRLVLSQSRRSGSLDEMKQEDAEGAVTSGAGEWTALTYELRLLRHGARSGTVLWRKRLVTPSSTGQVDPPLVLLDATVGKGTAQVLYVSGSVSVDILRQDARKGWLPVQSVMLYRPSDVHGTQPAKGTLLSGSRASLEMQNRSTQEWSFAQKPPKMLKEVKPKPVSRPAADKK